MPEYLSPGVYIEEVPARLKAIEGVSTSTAGMAGPAERGPVPGYPLPFRATGGPGGATLVVPRDPAPVLVTSYADFVRRFGGPLALPDPNENAYLERAVRGFFDNGGKRIYVSRVVHYDPAALASSATRSRLRLYQGAVLQLARRARTGDTQIFFNTLRGVANGSTITFRRRADGSATGVAPTVVSYNSTASSVTVAALGAGVDLDPGDVYAVSPAVTAPLAQTGPRFWARNPGSWSGALTVNVHPADRGPVPLTATAAATDLQIQVRSTASFYRGAIIEVDSGTARAYAEVVDIRPGNVLQLAGALGMAVASLTAAFARVMEIDVTVADESGPEPVRETFRGLSWNPRPTPAIRRRYYAAVLNARSQLVYVQPPGFPNADGTAFNGSEGATLATQPTTERGFSTSPAGADIGADSYGTIVDDDYVGVNTGPGTRTGIQALADVEEISILAAPGRTATVVHNALITQCENLRYRFAVLDGERDPAGGSVNAILAHRNAYDSSYAGYYQPWLEVVEQGDRHYLPPSGHVLGVFARTDVERGVHKAPANEVVRGITGLRSYITTGEQDVLNPRGVNAIREFAGRGTRIWGARTLSSNPEYRYVPVRRFLIFLEKSIDRGTQWVVFEPNNPDTWSRVVDSVSAFLHTQWRSGALFGRTPEQAFFVRCDESTMTTDDIENGRLICHIGVAITKPAEFVIFRIEQLAAFAQT